MRVIPRLVIMLLTLGIAYAIVQGVFKDWSDSFKYDYVQDNSIGWGWKYENVLTATNQKDMILSTKMWESYVFLSQFKTNLTALHLFEMYSECPVEYPEVGLIGIQFYIPKSQFKKQFWISGAICGNHADYYGPLLATSEYANYANLGVQFFAQPIANAQPSLYTYRSNGYGGFVPSAEVLDYVQSNVVFDKRLLATYSYLSTSFLSNLWLKQNSLPVFIGVNGHDYPGLYFGLHSNITGFVGIITRTENVYPYPIRNGSDGSDGSDGSEVAQLRDLACGGGDCYIVKPFKGSVVTDDELSKSNLAYQSLIAFPLPSSSNNPWWHFIFVCSFVILITSLLSIAPGRGLSLSWKRNKVELDTKTSDLDDEQDVDSDLTEDEPEQKVNNHPVIESILKPVELVENTMLVIHGLQNQLQLAYNFTYTSFSDLATQVAQQLETERGKKSKGLLEPLLKILVENTRSVAMAKIGLDRTTQVGLLSKGSDLCYKIDVGLKEYPAYVYVLYNSTYLKVWESTGDSQDEETLTQAESTSELMLAYQASLQPGRLMDRIKQHLSQGLSQDSLGELIKELNILKNDSISYHSLKLQVAEYASEVIERVGDEAKLNREFNDSGSLAMLGKAILDAITGLSSKAELNAFVGLVKQRLAESDFNPIAGFKVHVGELRLQAAFYEVGGVRKVVFYLSEHFHNKS